MKSLTAAATELFAQSTRVTLNPSGYAKLRSLPRQVLDIESQATLWSTGLMARIGDTEVRISDTILPSEVHFHLKDGETVKVLQVEEVITGCSECGA